MYSFVREEIFSYPMLQWNQEKTFDAACKKVLSKKAILAYIVKKTIPEFEDYSIREIEALYIENDPEISNVRLANKNPYIHGMNTEDTDMEEGTVRFDLLFYVRLPLEEGLTKVIVNVEAQGKFSPGYPIPKRMIYYMARMISSQHGKEFVKSHYEEIKKVYSIWICMDPPSYAVNTINRYGMREANVYGKPLFEKKDYDLMEGILICLSQDEEEASGSDLLDFLNTTFRKRMSAKEKRKILEEKYSIPFDQELEEEMETMDGAFSSAYKSSLERKGMKLGIKLGREQGVKQGKAQGIEQEKRETVRFMLQMNEFSLQKISEIARLPIERVKEIQEELNKKIS